MVRVYANGCMLFLYFISVLKHIAPSMIMFASFVRLLDLNNTNEYYTILFNLQHKLNWKHSHMYTSRTYMSNAITAIITPHLKKDNANPIYCMYMDVPVCTECCTSHILLYLLSYQRKNAESSLSWQEKNNGHI